MPVRVNDIHSQLNATEVAAVVRPRTLDDLHAVMRTTERAGRALSIAGGFHAMGGQQFGHDTVLIDMRGLDRVVSFDADAGLVTAEAGIHWPALLDYLERAQQGRARAWGIYQKQTGADRLSLGGALSCNAHGRALTLKPIVQQVESFDLLDASGELRHCSRTEHPELFRLAIGGYGLFGVIARVTLRLRSRVKVRRLVALTDTDTLIDEFDDRIFNGALYGDFQFDIDHAGPNFLRRGILSCYETVSAQVPLTAAPSGFSEDDWRELIRLAHVNKEEAFTRYARGYLRTSGQVYWSDAQLASVYDDHYHRGLDQVLGAAVPGSEMITELFVPRSRLARFMDDARTLLRCHRANVIYGTVRLIERDDETALPWARERYACVIFNLHVDHTPPAIAAAADTFRALIDLALEHGGSYYLTYHRWARADQLERANPAIRSVLAAKRRYDPADRFQSDWYRQIAGQLGERVERLVRSA